MAEIFTKNGDRILVDDEDFETLNAYRWCLNGNGYAVRNEPTGLVKPRQRAVLMHRMLLGLACGDGKYGDHANGNKLDNRRENLRICTNAENLRNQKMHADNVSGFKGVSFRKQCRKWQADIKLDGNGRYLGLFDTPELAHEVYCLAADMLHGEFANHG